MAAMKTVSEIIEVKEGEGRAEDGPGKEMDFRRQRRRKQQPFH